MKERERRAPMEPIMSLSPHLRQLRVRDLMTDRVLSLRLTDDLAAARKLMDEHGIRHVPIVDEVGRLMGLVSRRDLEKAMRLGSADFPQYSSGDVLASVSVEDAMVTELTTTSPESDIREAAQVMFDHKFGCLPVLQGGRLIGILTEADFVRFLATGN